VTLRAQILQGPHPSQTESPLAAPDPLNKDWSLETPPLRVRYGGGTSIRMTDQDHKTWKVSLYPDHLSGELH
jgi:hypothetical protein